MSSGLPLRAQTILSGSLLDITAMPYVPSTRFKRVDHRVFELAVERSLDQMREHLGVRLRLEHMALHLEHLSQGAVVLDDAVVHDRDRAGAVGVRMRVAFGRRAVRGPARVRDADRAVDRMAVHHALEHRDLALRLSRLEPVAIASSRFRPSRSRDTRGA